VEANLAGTEIFTPLKNIFESELIPGYLRQIFILTDGEVSELTSILYHSISSLGATIQINMNISLLNSGK